MTGRWTAGGVLVLLCLMIVIPLAMNFANKTKIRNLISEELRSCIVDLDTGASLGELRKHHATLKLLFEVNEKWISWEHQLASISTVLESTNTCIDFEWRD